MAGGYTEKDKEAFKEVLWTCTGIAAFTAMLAGIPVLLAVGMTFIGVSICEIIKIRSENRNSE